MTPGASAAEGTRRQRAVQRALLAIGLVVAAIIWVRLLIRPSSDLLNHQEFGRRFVAGTFLYDGGLNSPYLPTWAMAHAVLAMVPSSLVSALVMPVGLAALVATISMLERLSRPSLPLDQRRAFLVAAAALVLCSRFVIRDLLDGGENMMITALVWAALVVWAGGSKNWTGALLLGSAIALKLTAGIFLLVLVARRAYGRAMQAAAAAALFIALPALWMGPDSYAAHMRLWGAAVVTGLSWSDASFGVLGPEPVANLALRPAIGRWIAATGLPQARDWSAVIASAAIAVAVLAVLDAIARRRATSDLDDAIAWAAAGVLALVASPITWRAHLVAILPACYLLIRRWAVVRSASAAGTTALVAIAVPGFVLARGVAGEAVSRWSDGWSITTLALLLLLTGITAWPARR